MADKHTDLETSIAGRRMMKLQNKTEQPGTKWSSSAYILIHSILCHISVTFLFQIGKETIFTQPIWQYVSI